MKKIISIIMVVAMLLGCCAAFAEETESFPVPKGAEGFEGVWACDRAKMEIVWEEAGFRVFISWGNSAEETTEWEYNCDFKEDDHSLVCSLANGSKKDCVYDENGDLKSFKTVYEDGQAVFTLDQDHHLIWADAKEDAGKDMAFEYVGPVEIEI